MRFTTCGFMAALALAFVLGSVGPALAERPPRQLCATSFELTEKLNLSALVVPAAARFNGTNFSDLIGFTIAYFDDLYLFQGPKVGSVISICYLLTVEHNYCTSTLRFGAFGDITFLGPFTDMTSTTFANSIVGGTGIFNNAGGSIDVKVLNGGLSWLYSIKLNRKPHCAA